MRAERAAWGFILLTKLGGCALPYVTVFSHPTITVPRLIYIYIYRVPGSWPVGEMQAKSAHSAF